MQEEALFGISFSVSQEGEDSLLELRAEVGQLALLRRVLTICQQEFSLSIENEHHEPELILDSNEVELPDDARIKIGIVGPMTSGKTALSKRFQKDTYDHASLSQTIGIDCVHKKIKRMNKNILVKIYEVSGARGFWRLMPDYLAVVNIIILTLNLMDVQHAINETKAVFDAVLKYSSYPRVLLLLAGTACDLSLPSGHLVERRVAKEEIEHFTESLGIPYIECSAKTGMNVSALFDLALKMAIEGKMPSYCFRIRCRDTKPEFFTHPDFYSRLSQKVFELSLPRVLLSGDRRVELYRRVVDFLEMRESYSLLLKFHVRHSDSKSAVIRHEAERNLSQLANAAPEWIKEVFDDLRSELEGHSIEYGAGIISALKHFRSFMGIKIYRITLCVESKNVDVVCELLRDNAHLVSLTLSFGYDVKKEEIEQVAAVLKTCTALNCLTLVLKENKAERFTRLFDGLLDVPVLQSLSLRLKCQLSLTELKSLKNTLERHSTLLALDLSAGGLAQTTLTEIAEALCINTTLRSLNLSGNYLGGDVVRTLKKLLSKNHRLTSLNCSAGKLKFSELSRLLSAMPFESPISELTLSQNSLSEVGVHVLLKKPQIKLLDITDCSLTAAGMSNLLTGLRFSSTLLSLSLAKYNFNKNNSHQLADFIENNSSLRVLDLSACALSMTAFRHILGSLERNAQLKKINLSQNTLLDEGAQRIADFLRHNKTLTCLDVSELRMSDVGLVALSEALHFNASLRQLFIRRNYFTVAGISALLFALDKNTGLFSLDIAESIDDKEALGALMGFIPENTRIRALGFMPPQAKRTVDMLALYENALRHNTFMMNTHQDFTCQCGRCLCVKARKIVKMLELNRFNRFKKLCFLVKAYMNTDENSDMMLLLKKIPKDVLLYIFNLAYPELPEKPSAVISHRLFFKPERKLHVLESHRNTSGFLKK